MSSVAPRTVHWLDDPEKRDVLDTTRRRRRALRAMSLPITPEKITRGTGVLE